MGRYDALLQEEDKTSPQPPAEESLPAAKESSEHATSLYPSSSIEPPTIERGVAGRTSVPPPARTLVRIKRTITRYAFEFFQDQIENLKKFSLEEQLRGEKGSMSQMVREALDMYISKRKRTEG